jgi:hypothetical protein
LRATGAPAAKAEREAEAWTRTAAERPAARGATRACFCCLLVWLLFGGERVSSGGEGEQGRREKKSKERARIRPMTPLLRAWPNARAWAAELLVGSIRLAARGGAIGGGEGESEGDKEAEGTIEFPSPLSPRRLLIFTLLLSREDASRPPARLITRQARQCTGSARQTAEWGAGRVWIGRRSHLSLSPQFCLSSTPAPCAWPRGPRRRRSSARRRPF